MLLPRSARDLLGQRLGFTLVSFGSYSERAPGHQLISVSAPSSSAKRHTNEPLPLALPDILLSRTRDLLY